jgi:hypothetical protein
MNMYVCAYVCAYVTLTRIYVYPYTYMNTNTYMNLNTYMNMNTYVNLNIYIYIYIYINIDRALYHDFAGWFVACVGRRKCGKGHE